MTSGLRQHLRGRHGFSNYLLSWYVRWIAIMISSSDWIRSTSQTRSKRGEREKACVWERSVERWNKNTSLFLFINVINVCPHYLHACRMESSVWGTWKQEALIIVFTSADKNPWAVMISNYKYFSRVLQAAAASIVRQWKQVAWLNYDIAQGLNVAVCARQAKHFHWHNHTPSWL